MEMKEDPWWTLSPDSHASSPWTMVPNNGTRCQL